MPTARDRGPVVHVFLAIAVALPLAVAVGSIVIAMTVAHQTVLNQWLLVLLGLGFSAVVCWAAFLPPVRQVEVDVARSLLGVDLPEVRRSRSAGSRGRGAAWLGLLAAVGLSVSTALLYLLPVGVGLIAHPLTGQGALNWPGGSTWHVGSGWSAAWLVPAGMVALIAAVALVVAAGRGLRALAPRLLGPTLLEQVAEQTERARELAEANTLAREVHDGIGHTLTAMTMQVTAARRLLASDPHAADRSLAAVESLGRRAQADVDQVVGALRQGSRADLGSVPRDLRTAVEDILSEAPLQVDLTAPDALPLPRELVEAAAAVVREALTNAARHGTGPARLDVRLQGCALVLEISNCTAPEAEPASGRRGLIGLEERLLLVDGTLTAGPEGDGWTLRATLPT